MQQHTLTDTGSTEVYSTPINNAPGVMQQVMYGSAWCCNYVNFSCFLSSVTRLRVDGWLTVMPYCHDAMMPRLLATSTGQLSSWCESSLEDTAGDSATVMTVNLSIFFLFSTAGDSAKTTGFGY